MPLRADQQLVMILLFVFLLECDDDVWGNGSLLALLRGKENKEFELELRASGRAKIGEIFVRVISTRYDTWEKQCAQCM